MKVALCCIGRLENQYAVEFVEWYKKLGFDKIFIYDNNRNGEEYFEDVLQQYIDDDFVEITDFRNKQVCQLQAYTDCYNKHNKDYDWIAFFDFDEFLVLTKSKNIHLFLENFDGFQGIKINWMVYDDNDMLNNDGRLVNERFIRPADYNISVTYNFPENNHVKSIIRGGINNFVWHNNPHVPYMGLKFCNADGKKSDETPFQPYTFNTAYLKHYPTKTISEYISNKYIKGTLDVTYNHFITHGAIDNFFKLNKKTIEKENIIKSFINKNNVDIFIGTQKTFNPEVSNDVYKIIVGNHDIENNSNLKLIQCKYDSVLDDRFYSELYMLNYIAKNYPLKKYVGFCHNRRYFKFLNDIPNLDEIFETCDVIVAKPIRNRNSVRQQYASCHNIEDLYIIGGILADKYPKYEEIWSKFINGKLLIPYNMFIMKREDFYRYIKFIFSILDEYVKIIGTDIVKRIENNKEKYLKDFYPNNTIEYQYRIGGYLAERLTNVFIMANFRKLGAYPIIITEDKYKLENKCSKKEE